MPDKRYPIGCMYGVKALPHSYNSKQLSPRRGMKPADPTALRGLPLGSTYRAHSCLLPLTATDVAVTTTQLWPVSRVTVEL